MNITALAVFLIAASAGFAQQTQQPAEPPAAKGTEVKEVSRECWYLFQAKNDDYWFGSEDRGVYRYDGAKIVNYSTADGLSGTNIRGIQGDAAGNVYFTTSGGVCKFDGHSFTTLRAVDPPDRATGGGWRLDPADLWFAWGKGVCRYDGTTLYDLALPKSDFDDGRGALPNRRGGPYDVYSIYRDRRGHMWIGTGELGVCRYDGQSFGWLYEKHLTVAPNGGSFGIRSVIEDRDGAFWICNSKYRFRVQPQSKDGKVIYTREDGIDVKATDGAVIYFQGAVADAKGDLWFSPYGGGIYRYDGKSVIHYPVKDGGDDTQVFRIFKDNHGVMWLGTPTAGPYRFDGKGFEQFKP